MSSPESICKDQFDLSLTQGLESMSLQTEQITEILGRGNKMPIIQQDHTMLQPIAYQYPCEQTGRYTATDIFVIENDANWNYVGGGIISYITGPTDEPCYNKPYVSYVETVDECQKQGLGTARYRAMNELSLEHFSTPLHSDPSGDTTAEAAATWRKLVNGGEAELYDENGMPRFRFLRSVETGHAL